MINRLFDEIWPVGIAFWHAGPNVNHYLVAISIRSQIGNAASPMGFLPPPHAFARLQKEVSIPIRPASGVRIEKEFTYPSRPTLVGTNTETDKNRSTKNVTFSKVRRKWGRIESPQSGVFEYARPRFK